MIRTQGGVVVEIVKGSRKCIMGKRPFVVRVASGQKGLFPAGTYKLTKNQLIFDSEDELWDAIKEK